MLDMSHSLDFKENQGKSTKLQAEAQFDDTSAETCDQTVKPAQQIEKAITHNDSM